MAFPSPKGSVGGDGRIVAAEPETHLRLPQMLIAVPLSLLDGASSEKDIVCMGVDSLQPRHVNCSRLDDHASRLNERNVCETFHKDTRFHSPRTFNPAVSIFEGAKQPATSVGSVTEELVALNECSSSTFERAATLDLRIKENCLAGKRGRKLENIQEQVPCSENDELMSLLYEPTQPSLIDGYTADHQNATPGAEDLYAGRCMEVNVFFCIH